jgi:hypothetical protein
MPNLEQTIINGTPYGPQVWIIRYAEVAGTGKPKDICQSNGPVRHSCGSGDLVDAEREEDFHLYHRVIKRIPLIQQRSIRLDFLLSTLGDLLSRGTVNVGGEYVTLDGHWDHFQGVLAEIVISICDEDGDVLHDYVFHVSCWAEPWGWKA